MVSRLDEAPDWAGLHVATTASAATERVLRADRIEGTVAADRVGGLRDHVRSNPCHHGPDPRRPWPLRRRGDRRTAPPAPLQHRHRVARRLGSDRATRSEQVGVNADHLCFRHPVARGAPWCGAAHSRRPVVAVTWVEAPFCRPKRASTRRRQRWPRRTQFAASFQLTPRGRQWNRVRASWKLCEFRPWCCPKAWICWTNWPGAPWAWR
jgi:hypothetical protein